ncbi:oligosaccharide flippase family protein [Deefgea piscis]|uniref:Oligosaccharide flippase family protein n=1 Tax=Deefgea piscis TaxID=2739061 RepID=A0A6M8SN08_9NEIS|nr:oligosaccharide flippase family protein [Deefgea piscis]QKJ65568.1 oligosaccharide flippase family protein [Deefgea piscis]
MTFGNIIWGGGEKVVQVLLSLVFTGLTARYFGVNLFGAYQFALSILLIAISMTWLCPAEIFYSKLDTHGKLPRAIVTTSILYRLLISGIIFFIALIYIFNFVNDDDKKIFIIILLCSLLYSEPAGIFRMLLETQGLFQVAAKIRLLALTLKIAVAYVVISTSAHPLFILAAILLESMFTSFMCCYLYLKHNPVYRFRVADFDFDIAKLFFQEGIKVWPGLVAMSFFLRTDRLILEARLDGALYGNYVAAMSVLEQLTSISVMLCATLAPVLIYRADSLDIKKNLIKFLAVSTSFAVICILFSLLFSGVFIKMVYGQKYIFAEQMLRYMSISILFVYLDSVLSTVLVKNKKYTLISIKWILSLCVCFVVVYFNEGWKSGVYGYALGWCFSVVFSLVVVLRLLRSTYRIVN